MKSPIAWWQVSIGQPRNIVIVGDGSNNPITYFHSDQPATGGSRALVAASATESPSLSYTSAASSSANIVAAVHQGVDGGGSGKYSFGTAYRFAARVRFNNTSNCRFWCGLLGHQSIAAANFATDSPNHKYAAFRFSSTPDTVIQAIVATSSGSQTVSSTGVSVDTTNDFCWAAMLAHL